MNHFKRISLFNKGDIFSTGTFINVIYLLPQRLNYVILKSYCTNIKMERVPLDELKNMNPDDLKCDLGMWFKLVDEIAKAKVNEKILLPSTVNVNDILELTELKSYRQRLKYLNFLFKKEQKKLNDKQKKLMKKNEPKTKATIVQNTDHIQYGLNKNTLLLAFRKQIIHKFYNKRLANSILFGQNLIFDLDYDQFMWKKERRDCAAQLRLVYSINRENFDPYNIYFCNAKSDSYCVKYLQQEIPNIDESLTTVTEQSYLDIFPKENLIYLSPHAPESLKFYDNNAIYIIGAFVDTVKREHISLHKSQYEGIKSYSLPLDEHVLWGAGSKSLSINQVFSIMMTLRDTGDWKEAFKHVPTRKLRRLEPDSDDNEFASNKIFLIRN